MLKAVLDATDQDSASRNAKGAKTFVKASSLTFLTILGLVAVTNYVVNPYADYSSQLLPPLVQISRAKKVVQLQQAIKPPPGLILGSSRVMQLEPAYLETKTGSLFFNAGVNSAMAEDYLAMLNFYLKTFSQPPRTILLGIDVAAFSDTRLIDARLLQVPELSQAIEHMITIRDRLGPLYKLFDWTRFISSVRSLIVHLSQNTPEPNAIFLPDGTIHYLKTERQKANGVFDIHHRILATKSRYERRFTAYHHLSPKRQDALKTFLDLCHEEDIQVVAFITPLHPEVLQHLAEKTEYLARRQELEDFLRSLASVYAFPFFNFSDIRSFEGSSEDFRDGVHYLKLNGRRIIDQIGRLMSWKGF